MMGSKIINPILYNIHTNFHFYVRERVLCSLFLFEVVTFYLYL